MLTNIYLENSLLLLLKLQLFYMMKIRFREAFKIMKKNVTNVTNPADKMLHFFKVVFK